MPISDIFQAEKDIKDKLNSLKTFVDLSKSEKELLNKIGNSEEQSTGFFASQLSDIKKQQKRYQRFSDTSTDRLLNFLKITNGSGLNTFKFLRKKLLEVVVKIKPEIQEILINEVIKVLGCSQDQTYVGIDSNIPSTSLTPNLGIYIPIQSIDFFSNLKNTTESAFGKFFYEKETPSANSIFIPYGGSIGFPMNKQLRYLIESGAPNGLFFSQLNGSEYYGKSSQNLFDLQYTQTNQFGVSGDYFRIILRNRENNLGEQLNTIESFIIDYYSSIDIVDSVNITANILQLVQNSIKLKAEIGVGQLTANNKFATIMQRILGLCFDSRREIDVSGISKISELDGVDDSFFELNEIDLRNIDLVVNNLQLGVIEFEDCDNVKVPVNENILREGLINFRDTLSGKTDSEKVKAIEDIIDSISQNPEWAIYLPNSFNAQIAIDNDVIKKLPLAIASSILSPKVLLPIFALLQVTSNPQNTTNLLIEDPLDFLKKFKTFNINIVSKINEIFLTTLFDVLKRDILNLVQVVISDINRSKAAKKYTMILRLVQFAIVIGQLIRDYRRCKSLLDDILNLIQLINALPNATNALPNATSTIPKPLLLLTKLLPGTSPERATINTIQELQALGIPTGVLPDGSPNLMLLYNLALNKGIDKENSENGKIEAIGIGPTGPIEIFGKAF
jgi:hypothetical protein